MPSRPTSGWTPSGSSAGVERRMFTPIQPASERGTRLTLQHTLEDPDLAPKVAAGWHICLVVAERLLDGTPTGPIRGQDARNYGWDDLHRRYAEAIGTRLA